MAELADALDLGSSVNDVGVQVPFPAPFIFSRKKSIAVAIGLFYFLMVKQKTILH